MAQQQSNEQLIANDLASTFHLNNAGIAAFLGNFQLESGFSTTAYNPSENAHGWAQWENGRWYNGLQAVAKRLGVSWTSPQAQVTYLNQELSGPYAHVISALKGVTDPTTAAQIVQSQFEGSNPSTLGTRQANARSIFAQLQAGQTLTGGGSSGTSGGFEGIFTAATSWVAPKNADKVPGAPFDPNGANPPFTPGNLTAAMRNKIITWLLAVKALGIDTSGKTGIPTKAALQKKSNGDLLALFKGTYFDVYGQKVAGSLKPNPIVQEIEDAAKAILDPIGKLIVNGFLIIVGIVLIVLALIMLSHAGGGPTPGVTYKMPDTEEAAAAG